MTITEKQRTSQRAQKKINSLILREMQIGMEDLIELKENPSLLIDTGYEYVEMGDYDKALRLFSIGAMLDSSDPDILNGLGITLCELGKFKKSKQVLERSIRLNPNDAVTLANLAGVCWEMGEPEQAIYHYSRSLEVKPGHRGDPFQPDKPLHRNRRPVHGVHIMPQFHRAISR